MARENIQLMCEECKNINYLFDKNKKLHTDKLVLKKHCKKCKKTTNHKETKGK